MYNDREFAAALARRKLTKAKAAERSGIPRAQFLRKFITGKWTAADTVAIKHGIGLSESEWLLIFYAPDVK